MKAMEAQRDRESNQASAGTGATLTQPFLQSKNSQRKQEVTPKAWELLDVLLSQLFPVERGILK